MRASMNVSMNLTAARKRVTWRDTIKNMQFKMYQFYLGIYCVTMKKTNQEHLD